jgi:hypothetical protein
VFAASSNKYLKTLEVEDHDIYFYRERYKYKIVIDEDENSVKVKAIPEDSRTKVKITGADDLKKNDYKIIVKVTAENGTSDEYLIEASIKEKIVEPEKKGLIEDIQSFFKNLNIKTEVIIAVIGGLVGLILVIKLVGKLKDRKIDKTMDKF